ncbi:MAG TPA: ergothioneine biosynthesis protein EgtB [Gammaproteobacteria bacterium]
MNLSFKTAGSPDAGGLKSRYLQVRAATEALCAGLHPEDTVAQSMDDASPVKWHLAHTGWFFEALVLEKAFGGYRHFRDEYRVLFNSYYNSVGEQYTRRNRGLLTRPTLREVYEYRQHVDRCICDLLDGSSADGLESVIEVGLHHEQQHQELILTDIKHLFSYNPACPVFREQDRQPPQCESTEPRWLPFPEGLYTIGHAGGDFAFDNETPAHRAWLASFELASRPVTNREYLAFMTDGGYRRPELWLSDGWAVLRQQNWNAPLYWRQCNDTWVTLTLSGLQPVREDEPVVHVSYYEADAYARWAGARLPTEQEWEVAAKSAPIEGNFVESGWLHPVPVARDGDNVQQIFGDVWEWTQSPYGSYPGYRPLNGELAEYNGKFMCNQMVLRGGSCATPLSHIRPTYRNFFPPQARWQFSGLRLARDAR